MTLQEREGIAWGVHEGIGRIVLRRPERANSLSGPAALALVDAIREVLAGSPRVVLLAAEGPIFCAGGDIEEFRETGDRLDRLIDEILEPLHPAILRLATAPLPVVSAVGGAVGGAGIGLALCADFVLGSRSMKLRTGYAAIGLSPDAGASYFLARRIGAVRAKQWFMLSDTVDAARCLEAGVVDALYDEGELPGAAEALVHRLAAASRGSLAGIKALCDGLPARSLQEHLALEHACLRERSRSGDAREGIAAFVARRPPRFTE